MAKTTQKRKPELHKERSRRHDTAGEVPEVVQDLPCRVRRLLICGTRPSEIVEMLSGSLVAYARQVVATAAGELAAECRTQYVAGRRRSPQPPWAWCDEEPEREVDHGATEPAEKKSGGKRGKRRKGKQEA